MEHEELAREAVKSLKKADHLTYMTLPLVKDNKLVLPILENIHLAMMQGMDALLEYERAYKRISFLPNTFTGRYEIFRDKLINKYNITKEEARLIWELKEMINAHKQSPVEFSRPGKFVICNENFRTRSVTIQELKQYILITKGFLKKVETSIK